MVNLPHSPPNFVQVFLREAEVQHKRCYHHTNPHAHVHFQSPAFKAELMHNLLVPSAFKAELVYNLQGPSPFKAELVYNLKSSFCLQSGADLQLTCSFCFQSGAGLQLRVKVPSDPMLYGSIEST